MDPLEPRALGNTGLQVSALGLGGATLGNIGEAIPESQSEATILAAYAGGTTFFDTAPWYGLGLSEHRFGRVLREKPRESFVLSTKVGRLLRPPADRDRYRHPTWPAGLGFEPFFDYSAAGLARSHEDSLARLGLNRVDVLVIHDLDFGYQRDEVGIARCFDQLTRDGGFALLRAMRNGSEIRAIGAGIDTTGFIPRLLERFDIDFFLVAMPYTLLDQDGLEELNLCAARGVSVVIGAPFASGVLVGGLTYNYTAATPGAGPGGQDS